MIEQNTIPQLEAGTQKAQGVLDSTIKTVHARPSISRRPRRRDFTRMPWMPMLLNFRPTAGNGRVGAEDWNDGGAVHSVGSIERPRDAPGCWKKKRIWDPSESITQSSAFCPLFAGRVFGLIFENMIWVSKNGEFTASPSWDITLPHITA